MKWLLCYLVFLCKYINILNSALKMDNIGEWKTCVHLQPVERWCYKKNLWEAKKLHLFQILEHCTIMLPCSINISVSYYYMLKWIWLQHWRIWWLGHLLCHSTLNTTITEIIGWHLPSCVEYGILGTSQFPPRPYGL